MKMSDARGKGYERFLEWCNEPMGTGEGDFRDNATKVICAIQLALGDCTDDVPEMGKLRDRLVAAIEALKAKAAKWDELWRGETVDASSGTLTFEKMQDFMNKMVRRVGTPGPQLLPQRINSAFSPLHESGPGLRAQDGKYTTPNDETVLVDHGWDE